MNLLIEKKIIMTTTEILNLVSLRNEIVSMVENYITESNLTDEEVYNVIAEIVETVNGLGPI